MIARRRGFNAKRRIGHDSSAADLQRMAEKVRYGGNPEHKRNPGDFGLSPPMHPRPDKTLCDGAEILSRREALALLREGIRKGLISRQFRGDYPQNIWAVAAGGVALEAQLENAEQGVYHGYPMPEADPLHEEVLARWGKR